MRIRGFNIINLKPGCRSSLNRHVFTSGIEIEENIILKQNNLNLHLNDLIKVQQYEENEFLQLIKEEQHRTQKAVDIVDVRKKFHLKQLQKKSKINTIFGTTSSVVTMVILVITGILLYKFCLRNSHRQQSNACHFNRIEERIQLGQLAIKENPIANKPTQIDDSNETSMTEVDNRNIGTTIRLSDIIRNES